MYLKTMRALQGGERLKIDGLLCMRRGHSYRWGEIRGKTVNSLMFTLNFYYKGQGTEVKS